MRRRVFDVPCVPQKNKPGIYRGVSKRGCEPRPVNQGEPTAKWKPTLYVQTVRGYWVRAEID
jgi:hypothetical protein